jgi:hypothetical protein
MRRLRWLACAVIAALAPDTRGATLSVGANDVLVFAPFPPALEAHPADPDRVLLAADVNPAGICAIGICEIRVGPPAAPSATGVHYDLPGNLNCTESAPFNTPRLGNFSLEPLPGPARGWITTSSCELAVPFDYATGAGVTVSYDGQARLAVPTRHTISGSFTRYQASGTGASIASFKTNFTSAALRVGNRLVVATSNLQQAGASPVFNPGTVLLFDLDDSANPPSVTPASPFFGITSDPNPIALTALPGGRVLVTNAGIHDVSFPPLITGQGSIDVLDPAAGRWVGSIPLGSGNPGGRSLALDPTGAVALAGSQTVRQLFAIDVRGLDALPAAAIDPGVQRPSCNGASAATAGGLPCLRARAIRGGANPIALPAPPGTSGIYSLVSQVRFGESGDFAVATSFNDGGLALVAFDPRNLDRPHPLLASRFGGAQTLAATSPAGVLGEECCPGPLVLRASIDGALDGTQALFATASPNGVLVRSTLGGTLASPTGDFDLDGIEDALDNCPVTPNASQSDAGGVDAATPDGIGDPCQCGDVTNNGRIEAADAVDLRRYLAGSLPTVAEPDKCDVGSSPACDLADATRLRRALAGLGGAIVHACDPFNP